MMIKKGLISLTLALSLLTGSTSMALAAPGGMKDVSPTLQKGSSSSVLSATANSTIACPAPYTETTTFAELFAQNFDAYTVSVSDEQMVLMTGLFDQMKALEEQEDYLAAYEKQNELYEAMAPVWETAVYNYPDFNEFIAGWTTSNHSVSDLAKLEVLYSESVALEQSQGLEAAQSKWDEFYNVLWSVEEPMDHYDYPSFEEYMTGWMPEGITDADKASLEQAYDEAVALEESGNSNAATEKWNAFNGIVSTYTVWPSFEEYFGTSLNDLNISSSDVEAMKTLYEAATTLEKAGETEAAIEKWNSLFAIEQPYWDNYVYQYPPFEEYMASYSADISARALEQMKQVYDEAVALEQAGNIEAASEKWGTFYYIINKVAPIDPMLCYATR